jgi:pilus assembly protein Flp/PilA
MKIPGFITRMVRDSAGQDLIEYGLLASFISVVAIGAITSLGTTLEAAYSMLAAKLLAL